MEATLFPSRLDGDLFPNGMPAPEPSLGDLPGVDLPALRGHICLMDFDISGLLDDWEYQPGQVVVRRFTGNDGRDKIQLRVDLGLLQMNAEGRPDGKRPFGKPSLLEHYKARLQKYRNAHEGSDEGFKLGGEDCAKLQLEALQFHHRYICLLQLEDYPGVIRDATRNLAVFEMVSKFAEAEEMAWALRQFQPQLLMVLTRAQGAMALEAENYPLAIQHAEQGVEKIRAFFNDAGHSEAVEHSGEIQSLENWLDELRAKRPLSQRERLERALQEAVQREDYERAARVRDALRKLEPSE